MAESYVKCEFFLYVSGELMILIIHYYRFKDHLDKLNVDVNELYTALMIDAEVEPKNWDLMGRQTSLWKEYGSGQFSLLRLVLRFACA